jgi:biotin carboxyl carrier protein
MPGVVADLRVAIGDAVTAGQVVATIESMKLLIPLEAAVAGTVGEVSCVAGDSVTAGSPILLIRTTS